MPLQVSEALCECGIVLDRQGRHRVACARSGRLKNEGNGTREGVGQGVPRGGCDSEVHARLRDINLVVAAHDDSAIEVLATGLPLLRCALAADGIAHPGAARVDGAVCTRAREDKETKYSELLRGVASLWLFSRRGEDGARRPFSSWRVWLPSGPLRQVGVAETVASVVVSVLRSFLRQFVGGPANCVACPRWSRRVCP